MGRLNLFAWLTKFLPLLLLLGMPALAATDSPVLLREKFDARPFPPKGWEVYTPAGNGWHSYQRPNGKHRSAVVGKVTQSYDAQSWLISPIVDLSDNPDPLLIFFEKFGYLSGYHHLEVMVTADLDPYTPKEAAQWETVQSLTVQSRGFAWRRRILSLKRYAGQQVRIALVARIEPGGSYWQVDDLMIRNSTADLPGMPEVRVSGKDGRVDLSWGTATSSVDVVCRAARPDGRFYPIFRSHGQNGYTDRNLHNGITYWYRLSRETPEGDVLVTPPIAVTPAEGAVEHLAVSE
ncbi:MAG: choice-of-anchor J domain-containing protein [Calditrichaeota bacterium]|nr:choice-of-anchor J domain-containing protein [Calditrichota bacterium]HQU71211.1 choice-of-anchor J domain-containing protein [Calditrichia bacterium]